jgi:hypothetical protein
MSYKINTVVPPDLQSVEAIANALDLMGYRSGADTHAHVAAGSKVYFRDGDRVLIPPQSIPGCHASRSVYLSLGYIQTNRGAQRVVDHMYVDGQGRLTHPALAAFEQRLQNFVNAQSIMHAARAQGINFSITTTPDGRIELYAPTAVTTF